MSQPSPDPHHTLGLEPWPQTDPRDLRGLIPEQHVERLYLAIASPAGLAMASPAGLAEAVMALANCELRSYHYDRAIEWLARAHPLLDSPLAGFRYESLLATLARRLGRQEAAVAASDRAVRRAMDSRERGVEAEARSLRGAILAVAGVTKPGATDLAGAAALFRRLGHKPGEAEALLREADRRLRADDRHKAQGLADHAIDLIGVGGTPSLVAKGLYLRGRCRLALGELDRALSDLDFALDLAQTHESRELAWHVEAARADVLERMHLPQESAITRRSARWGLLHVARCIRHLPVRRMYLSRTDVRDALNHATDGLETGGPDVPPTN